MLDPPLDTNGNVTPVNGRISSTPNTLSDICTSMSVTVAQPAMT